MRAAFIFRPVQYGTLPTGESQSKKKLRVGYHDVSKREGVSCEEHVQWSQATTAKIGPEFSLRTTAITYHWLLNLPEVSNQNKPNPVNSPPPFSPSLPTKEQVEMDITERHHPAVKNRVATNKYRKDFLLYSKHAMVDFDIRWLQMSSLPNQVRLEPLLHPMAATVLSIDWSCSHHVRKGVLACGQNFGFFCASFLISVEI